MPSSRAAGCRCVRGEAVGRRGHRCGDAPGGVLDSNERAVTAIVQILLGPERQAKFAPSLPRHCAAQENRLRIFIAGSRPLGLPARECVVVEDSRNGLLSAKAAGMRLSHHQELLHWAGEFSRSGPGGG